jgi:hypothetical protein
MKEFKLERTHQESGTAPWKPVFEKKQEWGPNWLEKKMELAKTKVLKKTRYLITGSSSQGRLNQKMPADRTPQSQKPDTSIQHRSLERAVLCVRN